MLPRLLALGFVLLVGSQLVPSAAASGPPTGPDVSKYQHDSGHAINWTAVRRSGQSFAFIKASGHTDRVDPWFAREWAAAGRAGIARGAYHYAAPSAAPSVARSAQAQADLVVNTVGSTREKNDLGIVLDLEDTGGLGPSQLASWTHAFLDRVETRTGRVPILYTYVSFWSNAMANNRSFGAYPLWLARYGARPAPLAGWSQWTFWQHTSSGHLPGIEGTVDQNVMCCGPGTLAALADGRSSEITKLWRRLGGASGRLGLPLGTEQPVAGGWAQTFQKGLIATTKAHGTHAVLGHMYDRYRRTPSVGVPIAEQRTHGLGVETQSFADGVIVYSPQVGAHAVRGVIATRWLSDGGLRSQEGLPYAESAGVGQQFVGGGLYKTRSGVHVVPGAIRDRYEELGGPRSVLGLPDSEAHLVGATRVVSFEIGSLVELVIAGKHVVV